MTLSAALPHPGFICNSSAILANAGFPHKGGMKHHQIDSNISGIEADVRRLGKRMPDLSAMTDSEYQIWRAAIKQQLEIQGKGFRNDPINDNRSGSGEGPGIVNNYPK